MVKDQLLRGSLSHELGNDAALPYYSYAVGKLEQLWQFRANHKQPDTLCGDVADKHADVGFRRDVDTAQRLIKDQDLRQCSKPLREHDLLLITTRKPRHGT